MLDESVHVFDTRPAIEWRISQHKGVTGNKLMQASNPPYGGLIRYYLKNAVPEKEDVKVTILSKDGKVIRELKGPKAAGIQTIAWDLRYEPPFTIPAGAGGGGFVFFGGGPRGPMADPGEYTVKISAGGQTVQTKLMVQEDPRIQLQPSDREERLKTLLQISELQKRTDKVRQAVADLRTEIATIQANWKRPNAPPVAASVRTAAGALQSKADEFNKLVSLGGFRENGDDPTEYVPPSVTQRLMRLMAGMDGYTAKTTSIELEELDSLTKEVAELGASWKKLSDGDVAAFNKMAK